MANDHPLRRYSPILHGPTLLRTPRPDGTTGASTTAAPGATAAAGTQQSWRSSGGSNGKGTSSAAKHRGIIGSLLRAARRKKTFCDTQRFGLYGGLSATAHHHAAFQVGSEVDRANLTMSDILANPKHRIGQEVADTEKTPSESTQNFFLLIFLLTLLVVVCWFVSSRTWDSG